MSYQQTAGASKLYIECLFFTGNHHQKFQLFNQMAAEKINIKIWTDIKVNYRIATKNNKLYPTVLLF